MKKILLLSTLALASSFAFAKMNVIVLNFDDLGAGWLPSYSEKLSVESFDPEMHERFSKIHQLYRDNPEMALEATSKSAPFIDSLAKQGMTFNKCFAASNLCSPSRHGLVTGKYPERWGVCDLRSAIVEGLPQNVKILPAYFKDAGYSTGLIGKWHISKHDQEYFKKLEKIRKENPNPEQEFFSTEGRNNKIPIDNIVTAAERRAQSSAAKGANPIDLGFDYYFGYNSSHSRFYFAADLWENYEEVPTRPEGEFLVDLMKDKAISFIEKSLKDKKPFMMYYAVMAVHDRLDPTPLKYSHFFKKYGNYHELYCSHIRAVDESLKEIFAFLEKYNQHENTIVVITGDNGSNSIILPSNAPFRGGKGTAWLGGSSVPFIMYVPKQKAAETHSDALVSQLDIFPTMMDLAGIELPDDIDGESLVNIYSGKAKDTKRKYFKALMINGTNWFLDPILGNEPKDESFAPLAAFAINQDRKLSMIIGSILPDLYSKLPEGRPAQKMLFDVRKDPLQVNNIIEQHPEISESMLKDLKSWLETLPQPLEINTTHKKDSVKDILSNLN